MANLALYLPAGSPIQDPDSRLTNERNVDLVSSCDQNTIAIVGWSSGGIPAIKAALEHPTIPRLVLAATPFDEAAVEGLKIDDLTTKTLLVYGSKDPKTGHKHGSAWQKSLPHARLEMVPGAGHDVIDMRWKRILSHCAPGRRAG